jgi:NADH-quinone oxidoreductase subunit L
MGTLAIAGIPLFSGFFSKDEILWKAFSSEHGHVVFWLMGVITAALTAFYMFRLLYLTFFGEARYDRHTAEHLHESPKVMTVPLIILAVLSVAGGWIGFPNVLGGGAWFERFLEPVMAGAKREGFATAHHADVTMELLLMAATVILILASIYLARYLYREHIAKAGALRESLSGFHKAVYNKYWVDEFYGATIVRPVVNGSIFLWKIFDVLIIDGIANGLARLVGDQSEMLRRMQSGHLRGYLTAFLIGVVVIIAILVVR